MLLFKIDQKKCKRDGTCAAECPTQIIVQTDKKSLPSLLENSAEFCTNCGCFWNLRLNPSDASNITLF